MTPWHHHISFGFASWAQTLIFGILILLHVSLQFVFTAPEHNCSTLTKGNIFLFYFFLKPPKGHSRILTGTEYQTLLFWNNLQPVSVRLLPPGIPTIRKFLLTVGIQLWVPQQTFGRKYN